MLWTVVFLVPILLALFYSIAFLVLALIWLFVLPIAFRDIWRSVKVSDDDPPIVLPPEPKVLQPGESLHDRRPPRRW